MLLINKTDLETHLSMKDAIDVLRKCFTEGLEETAEIPDRHVLTTGKGEAIFMPGQLAPQEIIGIKIAGLYPENHLLGVPTIHSYVMLMDYMNGKIIAMLDGAALTAIRTGAMTGLATDLLAKDDTQSLALIGSGIQARTQLAAICAVRSIRTLTVYSKTQANTEDFAKMVSKSHPGIEYVRVATNADDAVYGADMICLATSHKGDQGIFSAEKVNPNSFIASVGGANINACEFFPKLFEGRLAVTDNLSTCISESGEIAQAVAQGFKAKEDILSLAQISKYPTPHGPAIFKSVGYAFPDLLLADAIVKRMRKQNHGHFLNYFG